MFSHADIWRAIDRLAVTFGYSPSGLAKKAGLDPTTFNKSKRVSNDGKPRWPSTESIAKILSVTGMTMGDFVALTDAEGKKGGGRAKRTIPLLGFAQAAREGYFDSHGAPAGKGWDQVEFPALHRDGDGAAYALEIGNDSLAPLYRDGDIIVVSPHATLRRGDRVVVRTKDGDIMIRELARKTAAKVELKALNKAQGELSLGAREVSWIARIIWVSQ